MANFDFPVAKVEEKVWPTLARGGKVESILHGSRPSLLLVQAVQGAAFHCVCI